MSISNNAVTVTCHKKLWCSKDFLKGLDFNKKGDSIFVVCELISAL